MNEQFNIVTFNFVQSIICLCMQEESQNTLGYITAFISCILFLVTVSMTSEEEVGFVGSVGGMCYKLTSSFLSGSNFDAVIIVSVKH